MRLTRSGGMNEPILVLMPLLSPRPRRAAGILRAIPLTQRSHPVTPPRFCRSSTASSILPRSRPFRRLRRCHDQPGLQARPVPAQRAPDRSARPRSHAGANAPSATCANGSMRRWPAATSPTTPSSETYELTPEQATVLADDTSPVFIPTAWQVPASMWFDEHKAIAAFRSGRASPGASTMSASTAASPRSTATPTREAWCRNGYPRSRA